MEKSAERFLVHALLRQRVNGEALQPDPPIFLKSARPAFAPLPEVRQDLPREHSHARRDHDEEDHPHPGRDVPEDFARGRIHVDHRNKIICIWIAQFLLRMFSRRETKHQANRDPVNRFGFSSNPARGWNASMRIT